MVVVALVVRVDTILFVLDFERETCVTVLFIFFLGLFVVGFA
jgi:hypothetical protein